MTSSQSRSTDSLGDRMKRYEDVFRYLLPPRSPVMLRVDGRAFHTFTRGLDKPFDQRFMDAMVKSALVVANDIQGFKAAYVQSDEVSFCFTDYDTHETQGWFDYNLQKVASLSASLMSVAFNKNFPTDSFPVFDSRAFVLPIQEVSNAFLWRAKDWTRNSLTMYALSFFPHKQLHGKNKDAKHEMLHSVGKNWTTDLTEQQRNGTFLIRDGGQIVVRTDILPNYSSVSSAIEKLFVCSD